MEFTQIENSEPKVIPAQEERVFDKLWLTRLRINSTPTACNITARLSPYDGETTLDEYQTVSINNLWEALVDENRPAELKEKLGLAINTLLEALKAEKDYKGNVEENITEEDTTDEEPTPEL